MENKHVFYDPNAKRFKWIKRILAVSSVVLAGVLTVFIFSIVGMSIFPSITGHKHKTNITLPKLPEKKSKQIQYLYKAEKNKLWNNIDSTKIRGYKDNTVTSKITAAFYATWQETGLHSLRANASKLTHLFPAWLVINADGKSVNYNDYSPELTPHNNDVINICRQNNVKIIPVISNANGVGFDPKRIHTLLNNKTLLNNFVTEISNWVKSNKFNGLNVDFENLYHEDYPKLITLLKQLKTEFDKDSLELSIDLETDRDLIPIKQAVALCNYIIIMVYDEHDNENDPGPISSGGFFQEAIEKYEKIIPSEKLVVGIGNYSTDWNLKKKTAESMTYQMAILNASDNNPDLKPSEIIKYDSIALNSYYYYYDENEDEHEVWMLDGVSGFNHLQILKDYPNKGIAVWALGFEDPSFWQLVRRGDPFNSLDISQITNLDFPFEIDFQGDGEVLNIGAYPEKGDRKIELDENNLISYVEYNKFPSTYVVNRWGYIPKAIALTFDDGPSDDYTTEILDILKKYNVKATFFVIGENAERYPSLIRRMWNEGHEIGSHTFTHPNLGNVSKRRTTLELNTTQRALQGILKRSTIIFRPPYNADAEPVSAEEIMPIITASEQGYYTIGELIDPQDWELYKPDGEGGRVKKTEEDICDSIFVQLQTIKGNSILLHDGGGNRTITVKALDILIPKLLAQGYKFITISDLMGKNRDDIMPPTTAQDQFFVGLDGFLFTTIFSIETLLGLAFITAIVLGISRVIFVLLLLLLRKIFSHKVEYDAGYNPFVSVILAAYNEEKVILKTIRSILASDYQNLEVIIVNDGSSDNTHGVVVEEFGKLSNVIIIDQENSGKAVALNNAIHHCNGEILVSIDADTQLLKDTISKLVRNFNDERIGAAAGNIKAGNRHSIISKWQSIEYITSQNMDRRAYSFLNAITVVPGAVGAWRKAAVIDAGGYIPDTLAEDMDLTWRLRERNWVIITENDAIAYTEVPDTFKAFLKQRFRWSFGTLQCLWKHKKSVFKYEWFGWFALPTLWLFQIAFQIIAPLVDIQILWTIISYLKDYLREALTTGNWTPITQGLESIRQIGFFYLLFFTLELISSIVAFKIEKEKLGTLWLLFWQRLVYRQLMYIVIWKAIINAFKGKKQGWGKLLRKGNVQIEHH